MIDHDTIGTWCFTMVKNVSDEICDKHDFANARLRFASANAHDNIPSLNLYLQFPQLDSIYTRSKLKEISKRCRAVYKGLSILHLVGK